MTPDRSRAIAQPDRILLAAQVSERLAPLTPGHLLDLGAGPTSRYVPDTGWRRLALDVSVSTRPAVVANALDLPLRADVFDVVLCTQVLEHVRDPGRTLREAFRVLRPGGTLILTAPQWNELHEEPHDYFRYTSHGLRVLLEAAGFVVVDVAKRGGFWASLAQMLVRYAIDRWTLYRSPAGAIAGPLIGAIVRLALVADRIDRSEASRRHCIGWIVVARKPGRA